jgi:hypothetical protein
MQTINKINVFALLIAIALMFSYSVTAFANGVTSVQFFISQNSYFLNASPAGVNMDVFPYVDKSSGRTLVPVRYLADALDAQTRWDAGQFQSFIGMGSTSSSIIISSLS